MYIESLTESDYNIILKQTFPTLSTIKINEEFLLDLMIRFTSEVSKAVFLGKIGTIGGPWELNLRDIMRWLKE